MKLKADQIYEAMPHYLKKYIKYTPSKEVPRQSGHGRRRNPWSFARELKVPVRNQTNHAIHYHKSEVNLRVITFDFQRELELGLDIMVRPCHLPTEGIYVESENLNENYLKDVIEYNDWVVGCAQAEAFLKAYKIKICRTVLTSALLAEGVVEVPDE